MLPSNFIRYTVSVLRSASQASRSVTGRIAIVSRFTQDDIKSRLQDGIAQTEARLSRLWRDYAREPKKLARIQNLMLALLLLWSLSSLSDLLWAPWRATSLQAIPSEMINVPRATPRSGAVTIDISSVLGSGLFGGNPDALPEEMEVVTLGGAREGIEQNAKETRLALILTGIVASTEDGLGSAVIKEGNREQVYAVGDALPAAGSVALAKVMARQVVIDNNGTYELIKLYESPGLIVPTQITPKKKTKSTIAAPAAPRGSEGDTDTRSRLAGLYRQQLYDAPESLARVVSISPVRDGGGVSGYRVAPGADRAAFDATGFQSGDIVKAVNGLALSDASNTLKLYQLMKDANQATFDIERNGELVTLSVDIASP